MTVEALFDHYSPLSGIRWKKGHRFTARWSTRQTMHITIAGQWFCVSADMFAVVSAR